MEIFNGEWAAALHFWNSLGHFAPVNELVELTEGVQRSVTFSSVGSPCPIAARICVDNTPFLFGHCSTLPCGLEAQPVLPAPVSGRASEGLQFLLLNTRSLVKHCAEVADTIMLNNIDFCIITESWLHEASNHIEAIATPPGYNIIRADRKEGTGGGVACIYRNCFKTHILPSSVIEECEHVLFKITLTDNTSLTCFFIYRPPHDMPLFSEQFLGLLADHLRCSTKLLVCGDLNFWAYDSSDKEGATLLSSLEALDLTQHILVPTHERGHVLDWVITHNIDVTQIEVEPCAWSDHYFVNFCLPIKNLVRKTVYPRSIIPRRKIKAISMTDFAKTLEAPLEACFAEVDVNSLASALRVALNTTTDKLAPEKLKVLKPETRDKTWFSEEIIKFRALKRRAEALWRRSPSIETKAAYLSAAKEYKVRIHSAKANHFNERIHNAQSNTRELFNIVKELEGKASNIDAVPPSKDWCQAIQSALFSKIDKHVNTVEAKLSLLSPTYMQTLRALVNPRLPEDLTFSFREVSVKELTRTVLSMRPTSYKGDICTAGLIQTSIDILAPILTKLVNISFSSAQVPGSLKESWITPLLKKAGLDPENPLNYRPITNVSFLLKILDKLAYDQVQEYITRHHLLNPRQSGFRKIHGTETALLDLKNNLTKLIDQGNPVLLLLLDLSAAFDLVDHDLLVNRLRSSFGFSKDSAGWIRSFLAGRTARVCVGTEAADPTPLARGVPQGSCLSPMLYNMFTSQLFDLLDQEGIGFTNYADDSQIFLPLSGAYDVDTRTVNNVFKLVQDWMIFNKLVLNGDKTEILILGTRQKLASLSGGYSSFNIDGCIIPVASVVKTLGVYLDGNMTMRKHALKTKSACAYATKLLHQIKVYLSRSNLARVAGALINSRLDYCNSLLSGVDSGTLQILQVTQNNAVRAVAGISRRDHVSAARSELHWLPVRQRIRHKVATIVHKCLHDAAPEYLSRELTVQKSARALRSCGDLRLRPPRVRLVTFGGRSFAAQAATVWNDLPKEIRCIDTLDIFRKKLKTHLFQHVT